MSCARRQWSDSCGRLNSHCEVQFECIKYKLLTVYNSGTIFECSCIKSSIHHRDADVHVEEVQDVYRKQVMVSQI